MPGRLSEEVGAQVEEREAIEALTSAFVQVRYAGKAAQQEQVSWLAQLWYGCVRYLVRNLDRKGVFFTLPLAKYACYNVPYQL